MSSVPPTPGGYPPYDPKTQWRIYRDQQKAARRAQRDAWRAQRYAWKANYGGAYGPCVPSLVGPLVLIAVGVVWLMIYSGQLQAQRFFAWYGHWWPLLLIAAGLALLAEWMLDMRRETPVRRGRGFVGVLILLAVLGVVAAGVNHLGSRMAGPWNFGGDNNNFFNMMGRPEHTLDQPPIREAVPDKAEITIDNPRGDVNVTGGSGSNIEVQAHAIAYAESDTEAQKIFEAEKAVLRVSGTAVQLQTNNNDHGRVDLTVSVPAGAHVTVNAGWNDVNASGLGAGISVSARGNIHLNSITGPVEAHFIRGKHDEFSARQVQGDIKMDGDLNDLTISEVKGRVTQNGELLGDVNIENVSGGVHLHTSVTDLEIAALPGAITLDSDDLRVNQATGAVHVTTHSKDVDLNQIYGDSSVENRNGTISIETAGAYSIEAQNSKGDVVVTLPPNASGTVNGRSHNGDIVTDYSLNVTGDEDKTVTGRIGAGAAKINLSTDNGDLRIKKGSAMPAPPPVPEIGQPPAPPPPPNARRLKGPPPQPVTQ